MLAKMNPRMTLSMRSLCLEMARMPGLAVSLSLDHSHREPAECDLVSWLSGLILGTQAKHKAQLRFERQIVSKYVIRLLRNHSRQS